MIEERTSLGSAHMNGRLWGKKSEDWANIQEQVHEPVYQAVLKATGVKSGTRLLDVGCGAGMAIQLAAAGGAHTTGLDAATELLEIAAARTPEASFRLGDVEALPFEDDSFDVVTGINSFQYAANPVIALTEARRVVGDSGVVAIVTWGNPETMDAAKLVGALKPLMQTPPPNAAGPFALSDKDALCQFAKEAKLEPVDMFDIESPFRYPDIETAIRGLCSAGVAVQVAELVGEPAVEQAYRSALSEFVGSDGSVFVSATFLCLVARPLI